MALPEEPPPIEYQDFKQCNSLNAYRAWPIFLLSFTRLFFLSIFERAFQNYLYFYINISESTLGFISSASAVAYIFGPIIGQLITSKLGIRNSLILSSVTTPLLVGLQMIYFAPWYLISLRIVSGLLLGVYWPNCYNLLSRWQRVSNEEKSKSNFKNYNYSWNMGFILGLLTGYFLALTLNEYITMTIAWGISFLLIPFSFLLKKDEELNKIERDLEQGINKVDFQDKAESLSKNNSNHSMIIYPILFSWLTLITYTMSKSIIRFSYPVFLKEFGGPSYNAYLVQLAIQIGQLTGLTLINYVKIHSKKAVVFLSIIAIVLISLSIILFPNIILISIVSASVGIFIGLIQGTSLKIMIDYGAEKNTKKYSTINEIIKGMGFGLTPIVAGFVAEVNVLIMFGFLIVYGSAVSIFLIYISRNIKKPN